jgi:hypothetical protein
LYLALLTLHSLDKYLCIWKKEAILASMFSCDSNFRGLQFLSQSA